MNIFLSVLPKSWILTINELFKKSQWIISSDAIRSNANEHFWISNLEFSSCNSSQNTI
ncbi:hypothetical protein [Spiroplasma endosymbiont of Dilophus febrilis]|uniref:hypothetical protein n=1 Tax=Spiroplasma endosymbiont of Dilophus febrilis TaxID=3066292 RepID=UPI00313BAE02